eukprot:2418207-Pleurochrysis_carterae.AAC.2
MAMRDMLLLLGASAGVSALSMAGTMPRAHTVATVMPSTRLCATPLPLLSKRTANVFMQDAAMPSEGGRVRVDIRFSLGSDIKPRLAQLTTLISNIGHRPFKLDSLRTI